MHLYKANSPKKREKNTRPYVRLFIIITTTEQKEKTGTDSTGNIRNYWYTSLQTIYTNISKFTIY